MSEHESLRELLALAAAGALEAAEQRRVERHLSACTRCAAELNSWRALAGSLQRLPTPQAPPALVERTRARIAGALAVEAERRWNDGLLVFLVLFAWMVALASWPLVQLLSGGLLAWLDVRAVESWISVAGYTLLAWLTAGVAALLIGLRRGRARRVV